MEYQTAKKIALGYLQNNPHYAKEWVILDDLSIDIGESWIFFYQDIRAVGGDENYELAGNLPVEVDKESGAARPVALPRALDLAKSARRKAP
jgi:hypothetical protein